MNICIFYKQLAIVTNKINRLEKIYQYLQIDKKMT